MIIIIVIYRVTLSVQESTVINKYPEVLLASQSNFGKSKNFWQALYISDLLVFLAALFTMLAASIYTHNINEKPWRFGWSCGLAWLGFISMLFVPVFHYIVQDVKFLGKSICI